MTIMDEITTVIRLRILYHCPCCGRFFYDRAGKVRSRGLEGQQSGVEDITACQNCKRKNAALAR
jgi:5-methylcytosine-specific restriction endonuclease McrA